MDTKQRRKIMLKNARKIGLFSGGIIGGITAGVAYLFLNMAALNIVVKTVIMLVLCAMGIGVSVAMAGLLMNSFCNPSKLSDEGVKMLITLKITRRIYIWTVVFFMLWQVALLVLLGYQHML